MRKLRARLPALALTLALAIAPRIGAQETEKSDAVGALNAAMQFRIFWLHDTTPLAACEAFTRLGRPADFVSGLNRPVARLLDRDPVSCDTPPPSTREWCPTVSVEEYSFVDSIATLVLRVDTGDHLHRQRYVMERRFLDRERKRFPMWSIRNVVLYDMVTVRAAPSDEPVSGSSNCSRR